MTLLGSHISLKAPSYFKGAAEEAVRFGETSFMFYTGAPQNSFRVGLEKMGIPEGKRFLLAHGIDPALLVVHAPYIINLANRSDPGKLRAMEEFVRLEIQRTAEFGAKVLVLHPGSRVGQDEETAFSRLLTSLEETLGDYRGPVRIALETMAGKGSEMGSSLEELAKIRSSFSRPELLGFCLDTCHLNDAGYDVTDVDGLLEEVDHFLGIENVLVIHLNDSLNPRGTRKDRHANLGYGTIGFSALRRFCFHPFLERIPKILETPYVNGLPPYKKEIAMLLSGIYEENWKESLLPLDQGSPMAATSSS